MPRIRGDKYVACDCGALVAVDSSDDDNPQCASCQKPWHAKLPPYVN